MIEVIAPQAVPAHPAVLMHSIAELRATFARRTQALRTAPADLST